MARRDDYTDCGSAALLVGYVAAGLVQAALNPRKTLRVLSGRGGWYDREIADAERRMAERNAENERFFSEARARHIAAAHDQEWPSP